MWGVQSDAIVIPAPGQLLLALKNGTSSTYVYRYFENGRFTEWAKLGVCALIFATSMLHTFLSVPKLISGMSFRRQ